MPRERPAQPDLPPVQRGILCPYCGSISSTDPRRCERCGGHFDPLSRQATQNAMGPWFIRDAANPFRPGCSFETVRELIKRGKMTAETILRGPSTRQYWNFASRTPGIANLLGQCHNCHAAAKPDDYSCAACGAVFSPETDRQHMGLAPVHLLPGQAAPEIIAAQAADQVRRKVVAKPRPAAPVPRPPSAAPPSLVARGIVIFLAALIFLGAVAAGVLRFVVPALEDQPLPTRPPVVTPAPSKPPESEPAPPAAPPSNPASTETARPEKPPEPEPPKVSDAPAVAPVAVPTQVRAALLAEPFDASVAARAADEYRRAEPGAMAEALVQLAQRRAEAMSLRSLP